MGPYGRMYVTMTRIEALCGDIWQDSEIVVDVLRPESVSDSMEVALWVQDLLRSIYAKVCQISKITLSK